MIKSSSYPALSRLSMGEAAECLLTGASIPRNSLPTAFTRKTSGGCSAAPAPKQIARKTSRGDTTVASALPIALPEIPAAPYWMEVESAFAKQVETELEFESSLHVTGFAAAQCKAMYDFDKVAESGVVMSDTESDLAGSHSRGTSWFKDLLLQSAPLESAPSLKAQSSNTARFAACLAMPAEPAENLNTRSRLVTGASGNLFRGTVQMCEHEVAQQVDRWASWIRRVRKHRRKARFAALMGTLRQAPAPPNDAVKSTDNRENPIPTP